jgi:ferredoxin
MKVVVDMDVCESNAVCMGIVPSVFEVQADGKLHVLDSAPSEDLRAKVEEACRSCPTQAIRLEA